MLKVADFRQRADECRRLAAKASHPQVRDDLIKMAAAWSELADGSARKVGESQSVSVDLPGSPDLGSPDSGEWARGRA